MHQGSLAFMKAHQGKYDEHQTKAARNPAMGRPAHAGADSGGWRGAGGTVAWHVHSCSAVHVQCMCSAVMRAASCS